MEQQTSKNSKLTKSGIEFSCAVTDPTAATTILDEPQALIDYRLKIAKFLSERTYDRFWLGAQTGMNTTIGSGKIGGSQCNGGRCDQMIHRGRGL